MTVSVEPAGGPPRARAGTRTGIARALGVRVRPGFGPTLPALAARRWRGWGPGARAGAIVATAAIATVVALIATRVQAASYSRGGAVPFSFSYRGLVRTAPEAGGYVRVLRRAHGHLDASFAVAPLALPSYTGSVTGVLPLHAEHVVRTLEARYPGFALVGEGPVRTDAFGAWEELPPTTIYYHVPTYTISFTAILEGRPVVGRQVWLVPARRGAREGVAITMLAAQRASAPGRAPASSALSLGTTGVLARPLRTFAIG
jgi:hypothetical protein